MYQISVLDSLCIRMYQISEVIWGTIWGNSRNEKILLNKKFPKNLKLADVPSIFKKKDKIFVENNRPVSLLPTVSKILEQIMQKQISDYIRKFFSPFLCGYTKGFSTQYALLMLKEWLKFCLDKQGFAGALWMDSSKDTRNHELLITKLHPQGFSTEALEVMFCYLQDMWQRIKINTTFSSWVQLLQEVLQRSVLGPILFNIYINGIFFALKGTDLCNFVDDTTLYVCNSNVKSVLETLK